ncbi:hypothetical protein [Sphingomonas sp. NFR15]|uniref:hypothetical protein n=1 Tax=Sphingomonas sp. NFR15 TaxID=1566282 RepID=UPI00088094BA|nr:hypothetical protein [Sphingomonas sp. NFR15]SDA14759.1 hypothetical protein SAMN03159340_00590 [Sphingomonas sp. NFR15]
MFDAIENAFPHLIRAIRRANGMTHMEAVGVIYAHRYGDGCGGVIRRAVNARHYRLALKLAA